MTSRQRTWLSAISLAAIFAPTGFYAWSAPPQRSTAQPEQRIVPGVPIQAAHPHNIVVRIVSVTPVEHTKKTKLLKLEVERYYGKITTASLNRAKKHETMRFSMLFPASPDADIRPGDLLNYWLVGYTPMRGGNVAENGEVAPKLPTPKGG